MNGNGFSNDFKPSTSNNWNDDSSTDEDTPPANFNKPEINVNNVNSDRFNNFQESAPEPPRQNFYQEKVRTEEELKVLEDLAQEETRIYKLYKDYAVNDLKRDKKNAIEGIKKIKVESKNWRGQFE